MSAIKHDMWQRQLESATRELSEIECKMFEEHCPWYRLRELEDERSLRLRWIEEARSMLGYTRFGGIRWRRRSRLGRLVESIRQLFRKTGRADFRRA